MLGLIGGAVITGAIVTNAIVRLFMDRDRRIRRTLRSVQPLAIRDVGDGQVTRIVGKVELVGQPLIAPMSGRRCAYYELVIKQPIANGGRVLARESAHCDFDVRDASGRARILVEGALVSLVPDSKLATGGLTTPSRELEDLLNRHGLSSQGLLFVTAYSFVEAVLEAGDEVTVGGLARWEPDPDAGGALREAPRRLVLLASGKMPLFVSDDESTLR